VVDYMNGSFADGRLQAAAKAEGGDIAPRASRRERRIARLNKPLLARRSASPRFHRKAARIVPRGFFISCGSATPGHGLLRVGRGA
jgi:hypothetical protein